MFCSICGLKRKGNWKLLVTHFRGHHKDEEPAFLKYDAEPTEPMYSNWHQWRQDHNLKLQEIPAARARLSSRPRKAEEAAEPVQEPQLAQIVEKSSPKLEV